jgi:thiol:disulfide interchange protein DsbC
MNLPTLTRPLLGFAFAALTASAAVAGEAEIRQSIGAMFPEAKIDAVRKAGFLGLYEVQIGSDVLYSDEKGNYVIEGNIVDMKARRNLTEERRNKLMAVKFSELPLDLAVKTVRGNGKRVFATFEDPNCGYCKKLAHDMAGVTDITMYTFLYPILAADSADKARAIWCSADRSKAWRDWMVDGVEAKATSCADPIDKVSALGRSLRVSGTPTIIFADGSRVPGYVPVAKLEEMLSRGSASK